jgi:hypothetical protein
MIAILVTSENQENEVILEFLSKRQDESIHLAVISCYNLDSSMPKDFKIQNGVTFFEPTQKNFSQFHHIFNPGDEFNFIQYLRAEALSKTMKINENYLFQKDFGKVEKSFNLKRREMFESFAFEESNFPLLISSANIQIISSRAAFKKLSNVQRLAFFSKRDMLFISEVSSNHQKEKNLTGNKRIVSSFRTFQNHHHINYVQIILDLQREIGLLNLYGRSFIKLNKRNLFGIIHFTLFFPGKALHVPKIYLVLSAIIESVSESLGIRDRRETIEVLSHHESELINSDDLFSRIIKLRRESSGQQFDIILEDSFKELCDRLRQEWSSNSGPTVVVFCHDDYRANTGGVQLFLGVESERIQSINGKYISVYPSRNSRELRDFTNLRVSINDKFLCEITSQNLSRLFDYIQKDLLNYDSQIIVSIHSLEGHSMKDIILALKLREMVQVLFYLHDYYSICSSVKLMRNDAEFCGAPKVTSTSCKICVYGKNRLEHVDQFKELFEIPNIKVISPSQIATDIWKESYPDFSKIETFEHSRLMIDTNNVQQAKSKKFEDKLRIAFIGYPVESKGWFEFRDLAEKNFDTNIEFYAFSNGSINGKKIKKITISQTAQNTSEMTSALVSNKIDLVMIWSNWPETYSYVTMESLAAGCGIITNYKSGNVAVLAERANYLFQYAEISELEKDLNSGRLQKKLLSTSSSFFLHKHSNYILESHIPSGGDLIN